MYINKMVFIDNDENVEKIREYGFPQLTDYDSYEILASEVQQRIQELTTGEVEHDYTLEQFEKDMKLALGEAYELLKNDELDFAQVIY